MRPIFDSHLDLAWNAISWKRDITQSLAIINERERDCNDAPARGHATTSLPEMRAGGVRVCLGTMMARVPYGEGPVVFRDTLDFPSHEIAWAYAQSQLAYYRMLEERGEIRQLRTAYDLGEFWRNNRDASREGTQPIGLIVAMEGSDAITGPDQVDRWWEDGLRCASLVHYGVSAYAHGTGTDGPVTSAGRDLLEAFERVGMILDVTHLCDASFRDAMDAFSGPVIASHQNCRKLVPGQRQFPDDQIQRVIERGGILGVALDAWMLHPEWVRALSGQPGTSCDVVSLDSVADHIDHVCQLAGNCHHVAIGSDLDGGFGHEQTPFDVNTIADLQKLDSILSARGYESEDIDRIFHGNYVRFFMEHLP